MGYSWKKQAPSLPLLSLFHFWTDSHSTQVFPEDEVILTHEIRSSTDVRSQPDHDPLNHAKPSIPCGPSSQNWVLNKKTDNLRTHYMITKEIRRGISGIVRVCIHRGTKERFACKTISKLHLNDAGMADISREVEMMQRLSNHPNVVKLINVYEDRRSVHLVMELCRGGDLADFMMNTRLGITELEAASMFQQVAKAVNFSHENNVFHRDLKPENIFIASPEGKHPQVVKIGDFGVSMHLKRGQITTGVKGTLYFFAPEMLTGNGTYGLEADIWSLGVVLFVLLMGRLPFMGESPSQTHDLIRHGDLDFTCSKAGRSLSVQAEYLIRRMLTRNPKKRATMHEILFSPWLNWHSNGFLSS